MHIREVLLSAAALIAMSGLNACSSSGSAARNPTTATPAQAPTRPTIVPATAVDPECGLRFPPASRYGLKIDLSFNGANTDALHRRNPVQAIVTIRNLGSRPVSIDWHSKGTVVALNKAGELASPFPLSTREYVPPIVVKPREMTQFPATLPTSRCAGAGGGSLPSGRYLMAPAIDLIVAGQPSEVVVTGTPTVVTVD